MLLGENETLPASDQEIISPKIVPDVPETVAVHVVEEPTLSMEARQLTDVTVAAAGMSGTATNASEADVGQLHVMEVVGDDAGLSLPAPTKSK